MGPSPYTFGVPGLGSRDNLKRAKPLASTAPFGESIVTDMESPPILPRRHPDTAFRKIGDAGGMVVLPGRSEVKVLNPVGIVVFSLLDGTRDIEALTAAVEGEFEISPEQARHDVLEFLLELKHEGMLAEEAAVPGEASR
jgi:hypothetical protein